MERFFYITYFCSLFYIVWFMRIGPHETILINLIPFQTIQLFMNAFLHGYAPLYIIIANLLGNILLTIPIGMLIARLLGFIKIYSLLFLAFYLPMHIESVQLLLHVIGYSTRTVDIDDVILNGCGILLGYYGALIHKKRQKVSRSLL